MVNFTSLVRPFMRRRARRVSAWDEAERVRRVQSGQLRRLLRRAAATEVGRRYGFSQMSRWGDEEMVREYRRRVPVVDYDDIHSDVLRMVRGERDVLWPGKTKMFAQSSGTSSGKSKYIPITRDALRMNHYAASTDAAAFYLQEHPESRLFSGKAFILGGSYANEVRDLPRGVKVGDLSATLISHTPFVASILRTPRKRVALMSDWEEKLPRMLEEVGGENVTSLSGVPSWFLILLRRLMKERGVDRLQEVWPSLEVFFHGGISFAPYRKEYEEMTRGGGMHFRECYNASEGFIACQGRNKDMDLQLLIDRGIYFEFSPLEEGGGYGESLPLWETQPGRTYALIITAPNGLWRYRIGDTVRITRLPNPHIIIAGRTSTYINAFGEELMEHNAEEAMARVIEKTGLRVEQYTAGPVYAADGKRGFHRWLIEFSNPGVSAEEVGEFGRMLDEELQTLNSDYQAKRSHDIFLAPLQVRSMESGHFAKWLSTHGSGKLGGQRKIPRLCPTQEQLEKFY